MCRSKSGLRVVLFDLHILILSVLTVLRAEGISFSRKTYGYESAVPASLMPYGEISYTGESYEYTHGQRAGYAEAGFMLKVVLRERDPMLMTEEQQRWAAKLRSVIAPDALNTGALAESKLVSRADVAAVGVENRESRSILSTQISVRYREV